MEDLQTAELEALSFVFTEDELKVVRREPLEVAVQIAPYTGEDTRQQFVSASLSLRTPEGYPDTPAEFLLNDIKGLSDYAVAELKATLEREAACMAGEMMLGHLCETAKGLLTEFNRPEGSCAFCLEPLREQADDPANVPIQKLPCYHCYHSLCFAGWYAAEQNWKREQRQKLQDAKKHAVTGHMLDELGLQTHDHDLFTILCPTCRIPVLPSEFGREEMEHLAEEASREQPGEADRAICLPEKDMLRLRIQQRQNKAMFSRQLEKGGIVADHYAVAI